MRWPWRRISPPDDAGLDGGLPLPAAVIGTSYAPPDLDGCALDIAGRDGLCPYCGRLVPHTRKKRLS